MHIYNPQYNNYIQSVRTQSLPTLGIVSPCFNEGEIITETVERIYSTINSLITKQLISSRSFMLLVDDGSSDNTWQKILILLA